MIFEIFIVTAIISEAALGFPQNTNFDDYSDGGDFLCATEAKSGYSCVPKANCDDLLDVRASGLLCVDASTTCCHQSKIIEASDDYEDEESCASLVDEGWSCVDKGSCEDILGVRTTLVCENQATQTCCHESKIKPSIQDTEEYSQYEDTESCSALADEGYSCVDNGNCGGILGVRTNLVCENQAAQTCCHESKIKQPNVDPDYYYDAGDTGEQPCSSFAVEGYSCVDSNNCGEILDVRNNLVCDNKVEQTCCHESKILEVEMRDASITCPELEDEGYRCVQSWRCDEGKQNETINSSGGCNQESVCCQEDHIIVNLCDDFTEFGYSCVKEANCEEDGPLGIRQFTEQDSLAEVSLCPDPSLDLNSKPRVANDPRSAGKITFAQTGRVCCHKERIVPQKTEDTHCDTFSNIGYSCVESNRCDIKDQVYGPRQPDFSSATVDSRTNTIQAALAEQASCDKKAGPRQQDLSPKKVCCHKENKIDADPDQGTKSEFGEWPHTCLIFKKGTEKFIAGGACINPQSIITSAHNIADIDVADITVRCGEWDLKNDVAASTNDLELVGHQDRPAKSISVHPRYSGAKRLYNDVAVIHLSEPYEISQNLNAIPLAESPESYDSNDCVVMGWGKQEARIMRHTKLSLVENSKCQTQIRATGKLSSKWLLSDSNVCAGGEEGKDVCEGDGGGPLVCKHKSKNEHVLVGIISWGVDCGKKNVPGIYASVDHALGFLAWDKICHYGDQYSDFMDFPQYKNWIIQEMRDLKSLIGAGKYIRRAQKIKSECIK